MPVIGQDEITQYVEKHIPDFHSARLGSLKRLELLKVLGRKNPYLFKAKGLTTPRELVKAILDAFLSSQEETMIGGFLEGLAIFVARKAHHAHGKSTATGIDLEFDKDGKRYLVAIKSGPVWGNASQIAKMIEDFKAAKRIYKQDPNALTVECVNGCCYGKQSRKSEQKDDYVKLCGQRFWEFISGDPELYIKIVEPLGHKAKERNQEFLEQYELVVDRFTEVFREHFCDKNNRIAWDKITKLACEAPPIKPAQKI
jgi:hypothetical protein